MSAIVQLISGQYYSAQLRFFRQLCTAAKVDTVSKLAQKMLDEGKCVVIGLQSTGELCAGCPCLYVPCSQCKSRKTGCLLAPATLMHAGSRAASAILNPASTGTYHCAGMCLLAMVMRAYLEEHM